MHSGQQIQDLERHGNIITHVKPEESILVDEMQNNDGEGGAAVAAEYLHDGPIADNDTRVIEVDDDMVAAEEEAVLRDGAGSSSDTRYALLPHSPHGFMRGRVFALTISPDHKRQA